MSRDTDEAGRVKRERAKEVAGRSGCGFETKTRHCQALRHRNHHPPRETLNHFYCIELSLLPVERTSKRPPLSPSLLLHFLFLSPRTSTSPTSLPSFLRLAWPSHGAPFPPLRPSFTPRGLPFSVLLGLRDNANAKTFTPLWLPKWNKFFNSRIYRRANESSSELSRR